MRSSFLEGKVPFQSLERIVLKHLGASTGRLIVGPGVGEDAAVIDMGDRVLALTTDPITAAFKNIGWLSVHINANDIAACGLRPLWYLCSILLPEGAGESSLEEIMGQIDQAARELNVSVIGGHSEVTPGLDRPIVIGLMAGEGARERYVSSSSARAGDKVIVTKGAGIEGTAILATDLTGALKGRVSEEVLRRAQGFIEEISVVRDAMAAMDVGGVDALHDPTEGGLVSGLWELAEASNVGLVVREEDVPVKQETEIICGLLGLDPLQIMSSGALIVVARQEKAEGVLSALHREGIPAAIVGEVVSLGEGRRLIRADGSPVEMIPPERDQLYQALERYHIRASDPFAKPIS